MAQYEGVIALVEIRNAGPGSDQIGLLTVQVVHYPESQQLLVWLPRNGWDYPGKSRLLHLPSRSLVEEKKVTDLLNGNLRMIWDTLSWPPGDYCLEIDHPAGGWHEIHFTKPKENTRPPEVKNARSLPVMDGSAFGKADRPRLEYEGNFRGGNVIYVEGEIRLSFWHEMGGGACKMFITIPDETQWEQATNTPVSRRAGIVQYIADTVKREKASSWRYEIGERDIAFY